MRHDLNELLALADAAVDQVVPRLASIDRRIAYGVDTKSSGSDLVTEYDRWSEETLIEHLLGARPDDGVIGEEGSSRASSSGVTWVIDPIDGTTNFVYDLAGFSVSVAARVEDRDGQSHDLVGVVHDMVRGERFRATLGGGATRDDRPIRVSEKAELETALVATGFSYDASRRREQAEALVLVIPAVRDIRRFGGAAADLCSLACGRVDAYYESGLSQWDMAAGGLIASEAGAVIDDHLLTGGAFCGSAPAIADDFFALLDRANAVHG